MDTPQPLILKSKVSGLSCCFLSIYRLPDCGFRFFIICIACDSVTTAKKKPSYSRRRFLGKPSGKMSMVSLCKDCLEKKFWSVVS